MIVSPIRRPGRARSAQSQPKASAHRRVTFDADSRESPYSSPRGPLLITSILSPSRPHQKPRASSAALPLTRSLVVAYGAVPVSSRTSSAVSDRHGQRYSARSGSAGYSTRTPSPGFRSPDFGESSPRSLQGSRSSSPLYTNHGLSRTVQSASRTSSRSSHFSNQSLGRTRTQADLYSSSTPLQRRRRPKTTASVSFHSRPLGAEMYPILQPSDLEREKVLFRSGMNLLERLLSQNTRSQSARWRAMAAPGSGTRLGGGEGESFCRSSLAESNMNNADMAKVYHVIPQRVLSARSINQRGINVTLQQANQSLCHRRQMFHQNISTTVINNNKNKMYSNSNRRKVNINTNDSDENDNDNNKNGGENDNDNNKNGGEDDYNSNRLSENALTTCSNSRNTEVIIETDKEGRPTESDGTEPNTLPSPDGGTEKESMDDEICPPPERDEGIPRLSSGKAEGGSTSPTRAERDLRSCEKRDRSLATDESDEIGLVSGSPRALPRQRIRGVNTHDHSPEWMEESKMKQEESVAILSEQLQSMIPEQRQDLMNLSTARQQSPKKPISLLFPSVGESSHLTVLPNTFENKVTDENKEEAAAHKKQEEAESTRCMKTMQCEVLGPYSCSDCTKIRLHERQQQEQTSLYPDLLVDPRTLVAPDRLRRLTATLPSDLTSQFHTLDCGCAINMHPDFLFPVIVTDHDIQSRLKVFKSTSSDKTEERIDSSRSDSEMSVSLKEEVVSEGMETKEGAQMLVVADDVDKGEEEVSMKPVDMKITVRYNSPPSEQKTAFITN